MSNVTIAATQMACSWDQDENIQKAEDIVTAAAEDGEAFSRNLLDDQGVAVLPGTCFGPSGHSYVRLSLTEGIEVLDDALNRIAKFCQ